MTPTPLAVAETDRIAALLAEVMPQAVAGQESLPADAVSHRVRAVRSHVPPPIDPRAGALEPSPAADDKNAVDRLPVREFLGQANWRNESPDAVAETRPTGRPVAAEPGPLPAPFGVLSVSAIFGLVNWRNRADEAQPLPVIKPPPPPGAEYTVEAMMPMFGWE